MVPWQSSEYARGCASLYRVCSSFLWVNANILFQNIFLVGYFFCNVHCRYFCFMFSAWCSSSFNDKPVKEGTDHMGKDLFEKEQDDLLEDLIDIPKKACDRKVS